MLLYSFFAHFIFCLLLCLLSYCATSSQAFLGGGTLETQTCIRIACFARTAVVWCASSRPRDRPWHHPRHCDGLVWRSHTQCVCHDHRRPNEHCASSSN